MRSFARLASFANFAVTILITAGLMTQPSASFGADSGGAQAAAPGRPQCPPVKVTGNPNEHESLMVRSRANMASTVRDKNFRDLESSFNLLNMPDCVFPDGRPRLQLIEEGISGYFGQTQDDWAAKLEVVEAAKKLLSGKPLAAFIEASYWSNYAWSARGNGMASSVSPEAWKLFGERMARSKKVLADAKDYASSSPIWYEMMLSTLSASGAPQRDRDAVFVEGVAKYNWYFPLYFTMATYHTPRWGGDWDTIDNLVKWSVQQTKAKMGNVMYARLYWAVSGNVENVFKETKASWAPMQAGFNDLLKSYPNNARLLNAYSRFACDAGDRATYLKARRQISAKGFVIESVWGRRRPEVCDAKFGFEG